MLAIELLAQALRIHRDFKGIHCGGQETKVSLYAYDLLLYVSDPISSLPCILDTLNTFGRISDYKLNFQKSELFLLNHKAEALPSGCSSFRIVKDGFKYLGIEISRSFPVTFTKKLYCPSQ